MKDIFIDTNVAKNFANPLSAEYKKLIKWLQVSGALAVSGKLIGEYMRTCGTSSSLTNIGALIGELQRRGRLNTISPKELKAYRFRPNRLKKLRSNREDHEHLKVVLLSKRKMGIVRDINFRYDINSSPKIDGISPQAVANPSDIDYE